MSNEATKPSEPRESPVIAADYQSGSQIPETTQTARSGQYSASDRASGEEFQTKQGQTKEDQNQRHLLIGHVASQPYYRERKSGKAIADFILAIHPEDGETIFHRVRAFDAQARKARDQLKIGYTDIEVTAYGMKTWQDSVKTEKGWTKKERMGYYAGFIKVPKRYREEPSTPKPEPNNPSS